MNGVEFSSLLVNLLKGSNIFNIRNGTEDNNDYRVTFTGVPLTIYENSPSKKGDIGIFINGKTS